jgi:hypothetical protein
LLLLMLAQAEPVTGEVASVSTDGKIIRVNLSRATGLKVRDGLRIFSSPEIVTLPGTDKAAFSKEREIASAMIVEVLEKELVAQVVSAIEPVLKGSRAVSGKAVKRGLLPPHIRESVVLEPAEAVWGGEVTLDLDVEDLDGDLAWIEGQVDGGLLLEGISTRPRLRWLPPAKPGKVMLTLRAVDRSGLEDQKVLTLNALGVVGTVKPSAFRMESLLGTPFLRVDDLGFDGEGNGYLLDGELRRIIKWSPSGRQEWVTGRYGPEMDFTRLALAGADLLLLDRNGKRVMRYVLDPAMFEKGPRAVYGGGRREPGSLRQPVDMLALPEGDVWVLDALDRTILTYAADGTYQTTVGSFHSPAMLRLGPEGSIHVLDGGSRQILTFDKVRLVRKTALPDKESPTDFMDPSRLLYANRWGALILSSARVVRGDPFGRIHIVENGGRSIVRLKSDGTLGGYRNSVGVLGPTLVRAGSAGGFFLENGKSRWLFDDGGWMIDVTQAEGGMRTECDAAGTTYTLSRRFSCGELPVELPNFWPGDFDVDPFGRVLLLETGTERTLRLSGVRRR